MAPLLDTNRGSISGASLGAVPNFYLHKVKIVLPVSGAVYTVPHDVIPRSEIISHNGQIVYPGYDCDYVQTGVREFSFNSYFKLKPRDIVSFYYAYSPGSGIIFRTETFTVATPGESVFTVTDDIYSESVTVKFNGNPLTGGATEDYTVAVKTITLDGSISTNVGDQVTIYYVVA